jgi:hypothetical protein
MAGSLTEIASALVAGVASATLVITAILFAVALVSAGGPFFLAAVLAVVVAVATIFLSVIPALPTVIHPCSFRQDERGSRIGLLHAIFGLDNRDQCAQAKQA